MKKRFYQYEHTVFGCFDSVLLQEDTIVYTTFADFYENYAERDVAYNLVIKFDVEKREKSGRCLAYILFFNTYSPGFTLVKVEYLDEQDEKLLMDFLIPHWKYWENLWKPVSGE